VSEGFLGRWSRRKADVRQGREVEAEPAELQIATPPQQHLPAEDGGEDKPSVQSSGEATGEGATPPEPELPPPTLEDVKTLTSDSDFTRFLTPSVAPEVKNAALKKLFSDPRYNVMDGLDVYIDDYSKPAPIPEAILRKLASAGVLGLAGEKDQDGAGQPRDVANATEVQTVAQSDEVPPAVPEPSVHDDPDLRLQQDDATAGEKPGRGTE